MSHYLLAIFAGALQGLTEFLPVSSSGHLILFHDIFNLDLPDNLAFDVILHWGTLAALVLFFYKEIYTILKSFFVSFFKWRFKEDVNQRLSWLILLAAIPAGLIGYIFEGFITERLHSPMIVAVAMIVVGIIFWLAEKFCRQTNNLENLNGGGALLIGVFQILALIPGVSRSGITIVAGMGIGLKRQAAAKFSFLLSIPVIFGAGLKEIFKIGEFSGLNLVVLLLGFMASFIVGYLAIKFFIKYLGNHSLNIFAWYRLIIGCLILIWLVFVGGA